PSPANVLPTIAEDAIRFTLAMAPLSEAPSPGRLYRAGWPPNELADALGRLQAGASQHEHRRLAGSIDATAQEFRERGGGDGGGWLDIEADVAEFDERLFDLGFGHCDGRAAGAAEGRQDFAGPHRLRDRRAFRDRRTDFDWRQIVGPGLEACVKRRAILG